MATNTQNRTEEKVQNESRDLRSEFQDFIITQDHPCVMAQSVFSQEQVSFHVYKDLGSKNTAQEILRDLKNYLRSYEFDSNEFYTFIAAFGETEEFSEKEFEDLLWRQLQLIHEEDEQAWDPEVSHDPDNDNFSFSIAGKAFYIVGMHPNSSRKSRQSPVPALIFNLHWQFERLRKMGAYQNVRDKIRERDIALQGNMNPMLEDFGAKSEARQYSGRKVEENWKCPFHQKKDQ